MSKERKEPKSTQVPVIAGGMTLGVIGAGVMGQTLIKGLLASGLVPRERLWAGDKNAAACENAAKALEIPVEVDFHARVPGADLILVAVKPADAAAARLALIEGAAASSQ